MFSSLQSVLQAGDVLLTAVRALLLPPGRLALVVRVRSVAHHSLLLLPPTPGQGSPPHAGPDSLPEAPGLAVVTPEEGGLVSDQQGTVNTQSLLLS